MKFSRIGFLFLGAITVIFGWYIYCYFFDVRMPMIDLKGLTNDAYYCGDVPCVLSSDKQGSISVWLDGKLLTNQFNVWGKSREYPFVIPTKTLRDGKHNLKIYFTDNTFNKNTVDIACPFNVDNIVLQAAFVKPDALLQVFQGRTLHVQVQANKPLKQAYVEVFSKRYECFPESKGSLVYECFIPVMCEEQPNEYLLSVYLTDNVGSVKQLDKAFQVVMYPFKKESLQVDQELVKKQQSDWPSERDFEELVARITLQSPQEKLWRGTFCVPTEIQRVSCEFGTIRTTQHKGRYAHKALDVINQPKSVVWAPQDGIVVIKDRFAASGNTIAIDHGCGVLSLLFHLDEFANIDVGQKIAQGNPVGTLGKTGYATGYHLHWEMRVDNIHVDPMEWTKATF